MDPITTFYLSRVIGNKVYTGTNKAAGKLKDLIVDASSVRPRVIAAIIKNRNHTRIIDFSHITISEEKGQYLIICSHVHDIEPVQDNLLFLVKNIQDKQIVDIDGRKLERVNDLRLAVLSTGTYVVAVDVGLEGLLRRLGVAKPIKQLLRLFGSSIPSQLILWEEVETISLSTSGLKLSKESSRLSLLHPSDLADIIEDLDRKTQAAIFASLEEEKAADVLEQLETDAQINVLESMSIEKAADVLEKMPADEVADILDELEDEKAEELLSEMTEEVSEEVRELMEYPDNSVGSLMTTDYISFNERMTVDETINSLRKLKPESDTIYYLYVLDDNEKLVATVSLRDIVISNPDTKLNQIMNRNVICVFDDDKIDAITEQISKYNLLAIPVVDNEMKMLGMVIIDDIVHNLLRARRRRI